MPKWIKHLLEWGLWGILFCAIFFGVQIWRNQDTGTSMPTWQLSDLQQQTVNAPANGAYIVHFFAEWCPICKVGYSNFVDLAQDYPVIHIATFSESTAALRAFLIENGYPLTVAVDRDSQLAKQLNIHGVPTTLIVKQDGTIAYTHSGYMPKWLLKLMFIFVYS